MPGLDLRRPEAPVAMTDLRPARATARRWLVGIVTLGMALHVYTFAFKAEGGVSLFAIGLFCWCIAPYVLAGVVGWQMQQAGIAAAYAAAALAGDAWMHHAVFIAPQSSTAALGLLFMPLWNLLVLGPAAALLAWLALRRRTHRH